MIIVIDENLVKEAEKYAELSKRYTSNRHDFHEGTLSAKARKMFEGKLGEKIVKQIFTDNHIRFIEDFSSYTDADEYDFLVFSKKDDRELKVDVKTRTESFHIRTLEMIEQFNNKPKDIYISVRLYKDSLPYKGEIIGFAIRNDFLTKGKIENQGYLDNYVLYDDKLRNIDKLIERLQKI